MNLAELWAWAKLIGGGILGLLLLWFIGWVIVSTLKWYREQDKKAQSKGYRDYRHYKQEVIVPRREAKQTEKDAALLEKRELTEQQQRLLTAESQVWQTRSTESLTGVASEPYIQQADLQLQAMAAAGLQREFEFTPDSTVNELHHGIEVNDDGKIKRGLTAVFGASRFTWRDQGSGEVMASRTLPFSELQFALASGRQRSEEQRYSCVNCGAPIEETNDDVLHCSHCGAVSYRSDYQDLLTQLNVYALNRLQQVETKASSAILRNKEKVGLAVTLLVILGSCTYPLYSESLFEATRGGGSERLSELLRTLGLSPTAAGFTLLALVVALMWAPILWARLRESAANRTSEQQAAAEQRIGNQERFRSHDSDFSVDFAKSEMLMMFKALLLAGPDRTRDAWAVYTEPADREAMQQAMAAEEPAVDMIVNQAELDDLVSDDAGLSRLSFYVNYDVLQGVGRSFKLRNRQSTVHLVRNAHGRTLVLDGTDTAQCPNCRAPVLLLNQDACKFCQTGFHRDETYWRISQITPASGPPAATRGSKRARFSDAAPIIRDALPDRR